MQSMWYQVEFFSDLEQRWVPLFGPKKTEADAWQAAHELLPTENKRVVKVTKVVEVMRQQ